MPGIIVKTCNHFNLNTKHSNICFRRYVSIGNGNTTPLMYKVHKIDDNGKSSEESSPQLMSYSDILKDSSIHVRDLFSLALTAVEEGKDKKNSLTGRSSRISRYKPTPVILPRGEKIVVSSTYFML